jgi:uncharacterized RDD family membrane protein YckC
MNCAICGTWNPDGEHRCQHCGRRFPPPFGPVAVHLTATAPKLKADHAGPLPEPPPAPSAREDGTQGTLFSMWEPRKVVPIAGGAAAAPARRRRRTAEVRREASPMAGQQSFEFSAPAPVERRLLRTQVEAVIFCDAPVASARHRAVAAAIDLSLILIASGLFYIAFYFVGGPPVLTRTSISFFAAVPLILALFYEGLWCFAGSDTPGCIWTHLKVLDFDGHQPTVRQRFLRVLGSFLSVMAVGLGYIWLFLDEESLTWQDHISKTFSTPVVEGWHRH